MAIHKKGLFILAASILLVARADAQPSPFYSMPDPSGRSQVSVEYSTIEDRDLSATIMVLAADVAVVPGVLVLGRVPAAHTSYFDEFPDDDMPGYRVGDGLGNVSLGVRYLPRQFLATDSGWRISSDLMVYLPTSREYGEGAFSASLAEDFSFAEPGRFYPDSLTARARADGSYTGKYTFVQGGLAFDAEFADDDGQLQHSGRLITGVGFGVRPVSSLALMIEFNMISRALYGRPPHYGSDKLVAASVGYSRKWFVGSARLVAASGIDIAFGLVLDLGVRF